MKILIAVHHFPPNYSGGAEWRAYRTASALIERGHTVRVVAVEHVDHGPDGGLIWTDEVYQGVPVRRICFNQNAFPSRFKFSYDNDWVGDHLKKWLVEEHFDLLHQIGGYLMSASPLRCAQALGIPAVVTLTDFWFLCPEVQLLRSNSTDCSPLVDPYDCARCLGEKSRRYSLPGRLFPSLMSRFWRTRRSSAERLIRRRAFLLETLNRTQAIICPSHFLHSIFQQAGVEPGRLVFSRQGRDFPHLDSALLAKSPSPVLRIGYLGQLAPVKGVHLLLEAVSRMPAARLQVSIYGDPDKFPNYAARLQDMADADPRVVMKGVYHSSALSQVLKEVDVVVVPSLWFENSPNVILEAFAHHTPVIAANYGGMAELVEPERDGLLFEHGCAEDLAHQIERLLFEPTLLRSLSEGTGRVKNVAEEMDELEAIYLRAAGRVPVVQKPADPKLPAEGPVSEEALPA